MIDAADEMPKLSRAQLSFFMLALWWPLLVVLAISSYDLWSGLYTTHDSSHTYWEFLLWWGIPGLLGFAFWMSRSAKSRTEQQALRMVWWAPVKFIPFYIVPWVIYGVCCLIAGQSQDAYMAFGLIMIVPYLLIGGYVCAAATVALYRIFF
ncbi:MULTISPECIES: hypothetical protein [Pseudomonas]|uniref:Transmembrane protein n=1 Tax=Pseudomonas monsensis TaxID=2745509 RepID=A0ABT3YQA5_9PSED|nr:MULTISPECIES: hypothetical protein [Pseudomonas]MBX9410336.1 hypothetical protein [Pseudomonas baetica]MCY0107677.1 hypothetical protein [Pseudomonas monsensis]PTS96052.1 hypothetical protein DBR24_20380 [Pseudomonas sp. HMWF006]